MLHFPKRFRELMLGFYSSLLHDGRIVNMQGDEVVKGGKRGSDGTNATCTVAAVPSKRATRTDDSAMAEPSSPGASSVGGGGDSSPNSDNRRRGSGGSVTTAPQPASGGQGGKGEVAAASETNKQTRQPNIPMISTSKMWSRCDYLDRVRHL